MCTVTFIPTKKAVFLTSNRDEKITRGKALSPAIYKMAWGDLLYPTDADKGGTWIIVRERGAIAVLLNGAELAHIPAPPYRKSRGVLLIEIMQQPDPLSYFINANLQGIEPLTLILFIQHKLYESRWDGHQASYKNLAADKPYIWSSSTLYTPQIIAKRKGWFDEWLLKEPITQEAILHFHSFAGDGDPTNDILMKREDDTHTVSITSVALQHNQVSMLYKDWSDDKSYRQYLLWGSQKWLQNNSASFGRFWCKVTNWEYWPFSVVYIPIYFYWFWLCLKARSLFFFNAANPTIRNGGFLMESKKEIYDLMPAGSYPDIFFAR